jgi:HEAT repeat protein
LATDTQTADNPGADIAHLIRALSIPGGHGAHAARQELIGLGDAAVPELVAALSSDSTQVRWEVAKTLTEIRAPQTAPALANALRDDDGGVRWLAADGLGHMGPTGVKAALEVLMAHSESASVREAIHHVLSTAAKDRQLAPVVRPVLDALDGQVAQIACLAPAEAALKQLG